MTTRCPSCGGPKRDPHYYLCTGCWFGLPADTRRLLWLRDEFARQRYFLLLIVVKTLAVAEITPDLVTPKPN